MTEVHTPGPGHRPKLPSMVLPGPVYGGQSLASIRQYHQTFTAFTHIHKHTRAVARARVHIYAHQNSIHKNAKGAYKQIPNCASHAGRVPWVSSLTAYCAQIACIMSLASLRATTGNSQLERSNYLHKVMTAAWKDLTLKAARHWVGNLILPLNGL